ncbi:MAG: hypothetical protein AB8I08_26025 [Sandaracinaceae bacterium]
MRAGLTTPSSRPSGPALRGAIDATRTGMARSLLNGMKIAKPCPASWAAMAGGDHVRACSLCDKRVYQLSGLTAVEAVALLTDGNGATCVRLYRRRDGSVMTADCKEGTKRQRRRSLRVLGVAAGVVAAVATTNAVAQAVERDAQERARHRPWEPPERATTGIAPFFSAEDMEALPVVDDEEEKKPFDE